MFVVILFAAIYLIVTAMIMRASDWSSIILFRVVPFFLGLSLLYHSVKGLGLLELL